MRLSRKAFVPAALVACGALAALRWGTGATPRPPMAARGGAQQEAAAVLSPGFVFKDVNHVLSTGQSLSVGIGGAPPLTTKQPYANIMLEPGVMNGGAGSTRFIPLVEGDVLPGGDVPIETMSSAFANLVTKLMRAELTGGRRHDLLVSVHGVSGTAYAGLRKGTAAYENGMAQVRAARDLAQNAGKSYVVRAVTSVHGESDHVSGNADYQADLLEWQRDYEEDARVLTGQTEPVPMFITQISTWTMYGTATSAIPSAQLGAHLAAPGKVVLVAPKYQLPYTADGVHLTNHGYRQLGEYHAKAYRRVVLEGRPWEPVRPKKITREGAVITAVFHVPSPPLALDTKFVSDPGSYGFAYADDSAAPPAIARVAVSGPSTVTITLAAPPAGANGRLRYALTGIAVGAGGGPTSGPRGNLRDSDATRSRSGYPLYNWCIHFEEPVP